MFRYGNLEFLQEVFFALLLGVGSVGLFAFCQCSFLGAFGRHFGASISAGQALGQKNTIVGIWLTLTFLNPLAAVAPGAYVVWQNLVNGWQLWYKEKYGKLKW